MTSTEQYLDKLREFCELYAAQYGIVRIGIFGSVARGEQQQDSDLDIYYEGAALGMKSFAGLPQALSEYFGVPVDVVRGHDGLNLSFRNRILKEIIYV